MPATAAQIAANQRNAKRSQGPVTSEGKERSRQNSLKHGLTGEGIVLTAEDAAEVERRAAAFQDELNPSGEIGRTLVRRAAVCSVRMDRGVEQETAALSERVRRAEAEFVAPEGVDAEEADRLRAEAGRRAMFDPSKEATLARKYEAAAERGFFRALKELRQLGREPKAAPPDADAESFREALGSFLQLEQEVAEFEAKHPEPAPMPPSSPSRRFEPAYLPPIGGGVDVPITIGRRR